MKRYVELAEMLAAQIEAGMLPVGARLPSVRHLTSQHGVGQSTVFRAYHLLEARGLIEAHARSGYYVAAAARAKVRPAGRAAAAAAPQIEIDATDFAFSVLDTHRHPGIVPLGSASPSPTLFPLQRLAKSLAHATRLLDPWSTVHATARGEEHLRRQLAQRYLGMGIPQPLEEIVVTNGAMEALNLCLMAVTSPGDFIAIESPCFHGVLQAVERLGLRAIEIPVDPQTGLDLVALENALQRHPIRVCWFMTNFHHPTGHTMSRARKAAMVALLVKHQVPLIEDDVYGELHFNKARPFPAKAFDDHGLVMHCSSLSKTLCPGYRLGWTAAGRFADKVRKLKSMMSVATSVPIQAGIADYLQHGGFDRHLKKLRASLHAQLKAMEKAIARCLPSSVQYHRPAGGYFLWLRLPAHVDAMRVHTLALEHGISVTPGAVFASTGRYRNYLRINFGHPWTPRFENALEILGELLAAEEVGFGLYGYLLRRDGGERTYSMWPRFADELSAAPDYAS